MGQGISRVPEAPGVAGGASGGREPIGRYIAEQRRLRGIELEDIAARTRIPRRSLERLEAGAFDRSPDGFSRGFVRTVAEAIGLDPDDAVARMLPEPDATRHGVPRSRRTLGVIAAAVALAALALGMRELASRLPARPQRVSGQLPLRRDYVRELAEQHGVETANLTARAALLPPLPPAPPAAAAEEAGAANESASASVAARAVAPPAEAAKPPTPAARPAQATPPPAPAVASAVAPEPATPAPNRPAEPPAQSPPALAAPPASADSSGMPSPPAQEPAANAAEDTLPPVPPIPDLPATEPEVAPAGSPELERPEPPPLPDAEAHD